MDGPDRPAEDMSGLSHNGASPAPTPAAIYVRSQEARWPLTLRTSLGIVGARGPGPDGLSKGPVGRRQAAAQRGRCLPGEGGLPAQWEGTQPEPWAPPTASANPCGHQTKE